MAVRSMCVGSRMTKTTFGVMAGFNFITWHVLSSAPSATRQRTDLRK